MDNFDKIIKQKVEQFEVPYNEAHWAEMDSKLNAIRTTKIKNNILGSVAALAVILVSSYFIFPSTETSKTLNNNIITGNNATEAVIDRNVNPSNEKSVEINNKIADKNATLNNNSLEESELEIVIEDSNNENKIDGANVDNDKKENNIVLNKTEVINNNFVNADFIVYNNKACLGEIVSFEPSENKQPVSYTWNFGDGTISREASPKHTYKESHNYTVTLTLVNRQTGKEYTTVQYDIVTVMPIPTANFSYTETSIKHNDNNLKYPYTTFKIKDVSKQSTYKWTFGNGENSTSINGKTIYKKAGNYTAILLVKDKINGCIKSIKKKITIINGANFYVENAFTPNNSGGNETFLPKALLDWEVQFEMTIINKTGKLIYKTSDKNEPWNGKMNNSGQVLNEGIYLWQVITYDCEGIPNRHHGKINLVK